MKKLSLVIAALFMGAFAFAQQGAAPTQATPAAAPAKEAKPAATPAAKPAATPAKEAKPAADSKEVKKVPHKGGAAKEAKPADGKTEAKPAPAPAEKK